MDTADLSIAAMGRALRDGSITSEQLTRDALGRIGTQDARLHAFVLLTADRALADATRADRELKSGVDRGPLHGIPHALKDIYDTGGIRTTCHSKLRLDNVPAEDSVVAAKFAAGGAVLLGKLATHEFAIGGPSFDLPFPPSRNPWNVEHVTGGSSSGSATAIAARMVRVAMGSDTGGSIRGPAAWCGLSGIKPTYGRVSRRGVFPLSWTLDHCGPLSRSVEDSAITLGVIAGHDPADPASADVPVRDYLTDLNKGVSSLRVGIPRAFFQSAPAATRDVLAGIDRTADQLRAAGATVEDIMLPDYALFAAAGRIIMMGEAYAIHEANMRSRLLDYGEITANRFVLGATVLAADYINALRARRELTDAVNAALSRYDVLLTASALCTAPRFDAPVDAMSSASPMQTIPFNVTGHPAMSVPVGIASDGLPIGVQIVGRPFDEAMVFRVCRAVEVLSGWESVALPV
ncbi:MAG: amidase [Acetobacteraceae bacterium]|jgi:aspartyl-tRNA(Asn)/glutamyl-tRNA(Gln) amidotransferase subunit A